MNGSPAPIALFVYNRPDHTRRTIDSLLQNPEFAHSPLFVFADGPKTDEGRAQTESVRSVVRSYNLPQMRLKEAPKNQGLAASVISGVTQVLSEFDRIIVVEDDLVLSSSFLNFMNRALEHYKNEEKVMHVSGYMYPVEGALSKPFFHRNASSWGWATWRRAWRHFDPDAQKLLNEISNDSKKKYEFNIQGTTDFFKMLEMQAEGKLDSWAVRWDASLFLKGGLSLYPTRSLVSNTGMDGSGTHCEANTVYTVEVSTMQAEIFPKEILEDSVALELIKKFYRSLRKPLWKRAIERLNRLLASFSLKEV